MCIICTQWHLYKDKDEIRRMLPRIIKEGVSIDPQHLADLLQEIGLDLQEREKEEESSLPNAEEYAFGSWLNL